MTGRESNNEGCQCDAEIEIVDQQHGDLKSLHLVFQGLDTTFRNQKDLLVTYDLECA